MTNTEYGSLDEGHHSVDHPELDLSLGDDYYSVHLDKLGSDL